MPKAELNSENLEALEKGLPNLLQHVDNVKNVYGLPCVVAINAFPTDTKAELDLVESKCRELGVNVRLSEVWAKGGEGGLALAEEVVRLCDEPNHFQFVYDVNDSIEDKLNAIATKVYHADGVVIAASAKKQLKQLTELGFDKLPICMAKTQFSFSDDASKLGAPRGFKITVRDLKVNAGAGFLVAKTGDIMTMPGLPKVPSAEKIDVDENGNVKEVRCKYIEDSKSGGANAGIKVKGVIHWVNANDCVDVTVNRFDYLINDVEGDLMDRVNKNSKTVVRAKAEKFIVKNAKAYDRFQFMRQGYYMAVSNFDKSAPVFNEVVGLKDSFNK